MLARPDALSGCYRPVHAHEYNSTTCQLWDIRVTKGSYLSFPLGSGRYMLGLDSTLLIPADACLTFRVVTSNEDLDCFFARRHYPSGCGAERAIITRRIA
jgi:hypothetical protein